MELEVRLGSILEVEADAIVNPANSLGYMGGGVAGVIKKYGGEEIEKEAIAKAPIPVGTAVVTKAGSLPFKGVIHAPTMERPAMETTEEKVRKAVRASLEVADKEGFRVIAMPGMGTGVGGLPKDVAAKAMLEEIRAFKPKNLKKIILVDVDHLMVQEWQKNL
ncbi:Appr-1-p processing domain protein [Thermocrinis albus DSM 14484]|uniref:Appr-1-p processing domain protein n=1 Tax=Thermocrinis albus (strain DSM 14484 / JCM 11386 / HI 11/12) TaxID=638303 RepID=D3SPK1_THEAH|nr:ADP-ribose-binding protein [Thermocrinis albus]ADC89088.1 Appr-1-p processing domain protein [Thermocrinis albus DSM 14484]